MTRQNVPLLALAVATIVLSLTLIDRAQPQPGPAVDGVVGLEVGKRVSIYLRGDASGVAISDRSPFAGARPAAEGFLISRTGQVVSVNGRWVVLEGDKARHVIPLEAVAVVDVERAK